MERTLDVGATLSEVFSTYRSQAGVLLPVAFWLFLVVAIVNGLISTNLALFPVALAVSVIAATLYQIRAWWWVWCETSRLVGATPRPAS